MLVVSLLCKSPMWPDLQPPVSVLIVQSHLGPGPGGDLRMSVCEMYKPKVYISW